MDKPDRLFDVRTVRRNIAAGLVTQAEYDSWLAGLDDDDALQEESAVVFVRAPEEDEPEG